MNIAGELNRLHTIHFKRKSGTGYKTFLNQSIVRLLATGTYTTLSVKDWESNASSWDEVITIAVVDLYSLVR